MHCVCTVLHRRYLLSAGVPALARTVWEVQRFKESPSSQGADTVSGLGYEACSGLDFLKFDSRRNCYQQEWLHWPEQFQRSCQVSRGIDTNDGANHFTLSWIYQCAHGGTYGQLLLCNTVFPTPKRTECGIRVVFKIFCLVCFVFFWGCPYMLVRYAQAAFWTMDWRIAKLVPLEVGGVRFARLLYSSQHASLHKKEDTYACFTAAGMVILVTVVVTFGSMLKFSPSTFQNAPIFAWVWNDP